MYSKIDYDDHNHTIIFGKWLADTSITSGKHFQHSSVFKQTIFVNSKPFTNFVFFSTKKCAFYLKKKQFRVFFLKMFRPLKGWYVLF